MPIWNAPNRLQRVILWFVLLGSGFLSLWRKPDDPSKSRRDFEPQKINKSELRQLIAQRFEHENEFMDHRLNWLLAIYAFAGAAIGFLRRESEGQEQFLITAICLVAFFASWSTLTASSHARAARREVRRILETWDDSGWTVEVKGDPLSALLGAGADAGGWQGLFTEHLSRPLQPWWGLPLTGFVGWPVLAVMSLCGWL